MSYSAQKNVIILTSGLSGSSVLAGMLAHAGFWPGASTYKKHDYDTFENSDLIRLNLQLFEEIGFKDVYTWEESLKVIADVAAAGGRIDSGPFRTMVEECEQHRPWVWKDPRLWLTMRFWSKLLDLQECRFIHLARNQRRLWTSSVLRRQVVSYRYVRNYQSWVRESIAGFLKENRLPSLEIEYEELIVHPDRVIGELSCFLDSRLSIEDLKAVYHGDLYRAPGSRASYVKALLIYLKNYRERIEIKY